MSGCTKDPFHQKGPSAGKAFTFTTPTPAWYWTEGQDNITGPARRAQFEALELLAAFLTAGDNKAAQNKLVFPGRVR